MALFKCKMCGGTLEVNNETVFECEYCGTKQTVPTSKDENLQSVYNRANTLRIKSEFDKAEKLYEKIVQTDETQAEAYWGMILCRNGIEYVEDPVTLKRIPTCHRASFESIIADEDYKSAIKYADFMQKGIYEAEAKEIDRIQKEIIALSQKEEPYDVFICYKETDFDGKRTQDSVIANDIYYQLTQEGFKVFYAAITLEDKLGSAYEPCIFAALNSAKVMLVIGTNSEYFNAVWVKNEWSRYLKIIKKDRNKLLIPCYKDMDAYDLPEEFSHLQAQDMSKIGFINDIVRGIKKVIKTDEPEISVIKETVTTNANLNAAPLLKRAFMFLEDGEWERAEDFCEQVLNIEPECAEAYLGKLMVELRVKVQQDLMDCAESFEERNNFQKVLRFGNEELKKFVNDCVDHITTRNENTRLENIYSTAVADMATANSEEEFVKVAGCFESIAGYKDAESLANECYIKAEIARKQKTYNTACEIMEKALNGKASKPFAEAIELFESISDWEDALAKNEICKVKFEENKAFEEYERLEREKELERMRQEEAKRFEREYNMLCESLEKATELWEISSIKGKFHAMKDYKDCKEKIVICQQKMLEANRVQKEQKILLESRMREGRCLFCGGSFTGVFTKKCSQCGQVKNY